MRKPTCVRAANGVRRVRIPAMKIPPPNIHFAPNRSANKPKIEFYIFLFRIIFIPPRTCVRR